jgi:hypothetical protein
LLTPIDVPAFLRDFEFMMERATTAEEATGLAGELRGAVTPRLHRFTTSAAFLDAHIARVLQRRLEKLNAKAEADAGAERSKAGTATKRG